MARKFMIVKPTKCCGSTVRIGQTGEYVAASEYKEHKCKGCGMDRKALGDEFMANVGGVVAAISESRIIWLPDEQDIISHDMLKEITA